MRRVSVGLRLLVQALFFFAALPLQYLAIRLGWRLAGWLPVYFHRLFLRMFGLRIEVNGRLARDAPVLVLGKPRLLARHLGHRQPRPAVLRREIGGRALAGGRPLRAAATDRLHRSRPPRPYGRGERDGRPAPRRGRYHRAVPGRHLERRQPRAAVSLVARRRGARRRSRRRAPGRSSCSRSRSPTRGETACR